MFQSKVYTRDTLKLRSITPQTALELAAAFGTSAQLWLNLEQSWQLSRAKPPDPAIARRAKQAAA